DELPISRTRALVEPGGVPLVQVCSGRLGQKLVDHVADEDVDEAIARFAGQLAGAGPDELAPGEALERGVQSGPVGRGQELRERAAVKAPSLDGRAVDHGALVRRQRVDASREQRL